ncbi:hypothetical protein D3C71_2234730 [compost metagenome]
MIRSALLVQDNIPVGPARHPVIQIANDVMAVTFTSVPRAEMNATFLAAFAEEQLLVWETIMYGR